MATKAAVITMTMREPDRLKTIQAVIDRMLRAGQAAQRLEPGRRQVERLGPTYVAEGPSGLAASLKSPCARFLLISEERAFREVAFAAATLRDA